MTNITNNPIKNKIHNHLILVLLVLLVLFPRKVFAENFSLGLSPQTIIITAPVGKVAKTYVDIENFSDSPTTLSILFKEFTVSEKDDNQIEFLPLTEKFITYTKSISVTIDDRVIERFVLPAKTKQRINMSIPIPKDETHRDNTFSIIFTDITENATSSNISATKIRGAIGTNILLKTEDNSTSSLNIDQFSTKFFQKQGPVPFVIKLHNPGDSFISPQGTLKIRNMFGQLVGKIDLINLNILANRSRTYFSEEDNNLTNGEKAVIWPEKFLLGVYSAELLFTLPENPNTYTRTIYFLAFPIQEIIILVLLTSAILFIKKRVNHYLSS
jgi:hypothetical protein